MNIGVSKGLDSAPHVTHRGISDNDWADNLMYLFNSTTIMLADAHDAYVEATERYITVRSKAHSIGAVRYDKDVVQSSNKYDLSDCVSNIMDLEAEVAHTALVYTANIAGFNYVMTAAGFDETMRNVWMQRYALGYSLGFIATTMHLTKSRVQYLLGTKASVRFCMTLDEIINYGEIID